MRTWLSEFARETCLHVRSFHYVLLLTTSASQKPSRAHLLEPIPKQETWGRPRISLFPVPETRWQPHQGCGGEPWGPGRAPHPMAQPPGHLPAREEGLGLSALFSLQIQGARVTLEVSWWLEGKDANCPNTRKKKTFADLKGRT